MTDAKIQHVESGCMPMLRTVSYLACCVSMCQPIVAHAQLLRNSPQPKMATFNDSHGITKAMEAGDASSLNSILRSNLDSLADSYARAAYYRTLFDLKRSSLYASRCLNNSLKENNGVTDPTLTTLCGELLAGNYFIQGDIHEWASIALETRTKVTPIVKKILGPAKFEIAGLGSTDFEKLANFPGGISVSPRHQVILNRMAPPDFFTKPDSSSYRKRDRYANASIPYLVKIDINGSERDVALDTGSSITIFRVAVAQTLGVTTNPTPFVQDLSGTTPNHRSPAQVAKFENQAHLGLVKKMTIKGMGNAIHLENVPIATGGHVDLLGMNVLTTMDSILLTHRRLELNGVDRPNSCNEPLRIASKSMGGYSVVFSDPVDGVMTDVLFDTGNSSYMSGTASARVSAPAKDHAESNVYQVDGLHKVRYFEQAVTLGEGRLAHHLKIRFYPDEHASYAYVLGVAALRDFNVYINFKRKVACLEPLEASP